MRFCDDVVLFEAHSVPIAGNKVTGYLIGLTADGAAVCRRMLSEDVAEAEVAAVDSQLLEHLERGGFFEKREVPCRVAAAYLHVTQRCNLDCVGCYSDDEARNCVADLPTEQMQEVIRSLADADVSRLIISGGEPFLRSDLPALARCAKERGIEHVTILTNGTRMTPEALAELAPHADRISVSFDGCSAASEPFIRRTQLFDALVEAVRMVRDAGIAAHILPTVHRHNVGDIPEYIALAERLGATLNFSLLSAPKGAEVASLLPDRAAMMELAAHMAGAEGHAQVEVDDTPAASGLCIRTGCGAGCSGISVAHDGRVYPCHMLHDAGLSLGSLLPGQPERFDADALAHMSVDEVEGCKDCDIRYLCGGGCRARAYYASGDLYARDPYCDMMREYYSLVFQKLIQR